MPLKKNLPPGYDPQKDKIEIVECDSRWPELYLKEAKVLRKVLVRFPGFKIEHIGSTSVPGLAAKPIIDIMVYVESWQCWPVVAEEIKGLGYKSWSEDDMRMFFIKWHPTGIKRLFHLHVYDSASALWSKDLAFRDHLRANPEDAKKYETLKRELAVKHAVYRESYTKAKAEFIQSVLKKIGVG